MHASLLVEQRLCVHEVPSRSPGMRRASRDLAISEMLCRDPYVSERSLQLGRRLVVHACRRLEGFVGRGLRNHCL
jgi:hypothetical protein